MRTERFWSKIDKDPGCWLWTGGVTGRGYGSWRDPDRQSHAAHRLAYELLVGPIPAGLTIDHLCRVKICVNPAHMELVTPGENIRRARQQTHCPQGHEYTPENNIRAATCGHKCRECHNAFRRKAAKVVS